MDFCAKLVNKKIRNLIKNNGLKSIIIDYVCIEKKDE